MNPRPYVGRFAPSPTGPLHAGSLVAAAASYLDARAHGGQWLLRIEDIDTPRVQRGATDAIIDCLGQLGMRSDGAVLFQSQRGPQYAQALERLRLAGQVYPCGCTRSELADSQSRPGSARDPDTAKRADAGPAQDPVRAGGPHTAPEARELVYPGTCRDGLPAGRSARAWRVRVGSQTIHWQDRNGRHHADRLATQIGDFVLYRADGIWAYQLAVVVDDAEQHITDVVRGDDLEGSTSRQIHLQQRLGFPSPRYLHLPVVMAADGQKLSKQTGAQALDPSRPIEALNDALGHLGLAPVRATSVDRFWAQATERWAQSRWMRAEDPHAPQTVSA